MSSTFHYFKKIFNVGINILGSKLLTTTVTQTTLTRTSTTTSTTAITGSDRFCLLYIKVQHQFSLPSNFSDATSFIKIIVEIL